MLALVTLIPCIVAPAAALGANRRALQVRFEDIGAQGTHRVATPKQETNKFPQHIHVITHGEGESLATGIRDNTGGDLVSQGDTASGGTTSSNPAWC